MAINLFGQSKNRRPIRDAAGIAPSVQYSAQKLYTRLSAYQAPSGGGRKVFAVVNGGHKYCITAAWDTTGALKRIGLHKPTSTNHGCAELAHIRVEPSGLGDGSVALISVDNFPKEGLGAFHLRHKNKLARRWNLAANGIAFGELTAVAPW